MYHIKKVLFYIVILLIIIFTFALYKKNKSKQNQNDIDTLNNVITTKVTTTTNQPKYTIGWSVYNNSFEYFQRMTEGVLSRANELGMNVLTHDQKSSATEMITGVTKLIEQGINALVISPINPDGMFLITDLAKQANIPVIVVDIGTGGADVNAFVITDSYGGGVLAGEYALELIKEHSITSKNVAIIKVEETAKYARQRGEGFKRIMKDNVYTVVAEETANSEQSQGYEVMKKILDSYGDDLAVVFSENDRMALGAAKAIEEAGKKGQIMVIGFDGDPAAISVIKDGLMQGTIAQKPFEMGALGAELAYMAIQGKPIIFDDLDDRALFVEVYLIDETGEPRNYVE
jgi:ribose transport system substrate-binding protein